MERNRLCLDALRRRETPEPPPTDLRFTELANSEPPVPLTRRKLLGLAGAAAVALPPGGNALGARLHGPVEFHHADQQATFALGGRERWRVDARAYAGRPRLTVRRGEQALDLTLAGARYPGTDLPADFHCLITWGLLGLRMRVSLTLGGLRAEVPFASWLAGHEVARGRADLGSHSMRLGGDAVLTLAGAADACLDRHWVLRLTAPRVAVLEGAGTPLASDDISLAPLAVGAPSLMETAPPRRSLLVMARGDHEWNIAARMAAPEHSRLRETGQAFSLLHLETGETDAGTRRCAVAARGDGGGSLALSPDLRLPGADGEPARLRLSDPTWARAFDDGGDHTALAATVATEPVWVRGEGWSVQLTGGAGAGGVEIVNDGGRATLRCEPVVAMLAVPPAGALAEPAAPIAPVQLSLGGDGPLLAQAPRPIPRPIPRPAPEQPQPRPPAPAPPAPPPERQIQPGRLVVPRVPITVGPVLPAPGLDLLNLPLDNFLFPVVRAGDLLALTFQFINLKFSTGTGGARQLVRATEGRPAHIVVHLPAQHIAEQAFLEAAPEVPDAPDAADGETPTPPPVQARLSGPSRLVFRLPDDMQAIPYTLAALLDWRRLTLAVAPNALPPSPPPAGLRLPGRDAVIQMPGGGTALPGAPLPSRPRPGIQPRSGAPGPAPAVAARAWELATPGARRMGQVIAPSAGPIVSAEGLRMALERIATPHEPDKLHTAIEAPYKLILSPNSTAAWLHAVQEVTHDGRTELWHTRLGVRADDGRVHDGRYIYADEGGVLRVAAVATRATRGEWYRTLRAIWSPDYSETLPTHVDRPFRMSLDRRDRCELVWLTSDFSIPGARDRIVQAHRFMLSALGVWMNTRYGAELPFGKGLSVEEWAHRATLGRDHYVRVVYAGYLYPFGHAASLVKVTERKLERHGSGDVAYLRLRYFIVVRQPERSYPAHGQPRDAREMPLRTVTIKTLVTPNLDAFEGIIPGKSAQAAFWIRSGGRDLAFHAVGEDWDGHEVEFTMPLIFVGAEDRIAYDRDMLDAVNTEYTREDNAARRRAVTAGQKVAFAPGSADKPGDTTLEAEALTFTALEPPEQLTVDALEQARQLCAYPALEQAAVRIPALAEIVGQAGTVNITLHNAFVNGAWDNAANRGQVFAELSQSAGMDFPADVSGGMVTPSMAITGLSRKFGPVGGDPGQLATGVFDPEDFFKGVEAKILGGINLATIIAKVFGDTKVPTLKARPIYPGNDPLMLPQAVEATLHWEPDVQEFLVFKPQPDCKLTLDGLLRTELTGAMQSTFSMTAQITRFAVDLEFIIVHFNRLTFVAATGRKADVDVDIQNVEFGGPLEFVNALRDYMRSGALGGVSIDITGNGIHAGFALAIPDITLGVMSLQNIKLAAGITLPFNGDPVRLRFAFNERANPFLLTVTVFGGGGFFALELLPTGVDVVEASLEFGGNFALNLGVASGGVYLMAGIYFKLDHNDETDTDDVQLTGYVRCGGHVDVLGIICISVEFYLGLTYESVGGRSRVWGQASLKVGIKVLFFSMTVTLSVEREFAGSSAQARSLDGVRFAQAPGAPTGVSIGPSALKAPRIADTLTAQDWAAYCQAFA